MSVFDVQIIQPPNNILYIEAVSGSGTSTIEIIQSGNPTIEIIEDITLLPSEFNTLVNAQIVEFIDAGSGILLSSSPTGLIINSSLSAGSGISITHSSGTYTISNSYIIDNEQIQDIVSNLLVAGKNINIAYDDDNNLITIATTGLQPSGDYSLNGHTHQSTDILNFNSAVSGLITVTNIVSGSGIAVTNNSGIFTVATTGDFGLTTEQVDDRVSNLLKSGNYINITYDDLNNNLTIEATGLQPSGNYSIIGHTHSTSDINNFNVDVSGLLPIISGSGYIVSFFNNNIYTISASGLQPSGNYSVVGHTHISSDITDFNSSVSGLIPPSNFTSLTGISGIVVTNSGTDYYVGLSDPTIQLGDITDLSNSAQTFLLTPSSSNLLSLISDETGTGSLVFNTSPAFSGTPTVPTAPSGTNTNQIASTQFVRTEITNLIDSAPATLDTLNELAAALGDDPNFATTIASGLGQKANLSGAIFTGSVTIPSGTGNFNSLTVNNISVSVVGHTHTSSNITDFNSSVSGLLPVKNLTSGSGINISSSSGNYTITATGLALATHQHSYTDITNFASGVESSVSTLLQAGSYVDLDYDGINDTLTINVTGVQPSGNYSVVGHNHTVSDITDFNAGVSGLLPVKNITAGSGIGILSVSGDFTVSVTGTFGLTGEEVDDRVSSLLVAGTGVEIIYNDPSGTLTLNNKHTEINILSKEPQGFVDRTSSVFSFNDSTRTFTIQPAISGGSYVIYVEGTKVIKNSIESVVIGSGTALNYIHFETTPPYNLHTKTTGFNFDTDVPVSFIHWNGDINQSTFLGEERHGIRMDSTTHKWIHNTFGMQYISGLSIGGYTLLGNGSSNSHAQIDISDGVLYQEDIIINITNGVGSGSFIQQLSPIAYIPTYYHSGSTGQWVRDAATAFPIKYNATRAQYNLYSGGVWTTPNVTNNRYFAMWIVATNDINDPILAIVGQREDSSITSAESNNRWGDINLNNIPTQELRPLYRLIFVTNDTFTNTPKSSLQSVLDIRASIQSTVAGVTQNDHGSLFGLADDDHSQYIHINNARTIDAIHTFTNGITFDGSGTQTVPYIPSNVNITNGSGNFSLLTVNSVNVSVSGHSHTVSNISDFNSGVSGLLPITNIIAGSNVTVSSSGTIFTISSIGGSGSGISNEDIDDRVASLLSAGSGINLNYDDNANLLTISTSGLQPSGNYSIVGHSHISSDITDFNSSVSGLLPTISNSGDNRVLTSTGSSVGINAENNLTFDGSTFNIDGNLTFDSFTESIIAIGNSSTSQTIAIGSGTVQTCTLTDNCTFTMPSTVAGKSFTMFLNTGSGNYTASFSGVLWNDSSPPTITTTSNKVDIISFISDGSYWYGSYSQNYGS